MQVQTSKVSFTNLSCEASIRKFAEAHRGEKNGILRISIEHRLKEYNNVQPDGINISAISELCLHFRRTMMERRKAVTEFAEMLLTI